MAYRWIRAKLKELLVDKRITDKGNAPLNEHRRTRGGREGGSVPMSGFCGGAIRD